MFLNFVLMLIKRVFSRYVYVFGSIFLTLLSVRLIAASNHVQLNYYMPRYFAVPLLIAFLVGAMALFDLLTIEKTLAKYAKPVHFSFRVLVLFLFFFTLFVFMLSDIGYGEGKSDSSGFVNTGQSLSEEIVKGIEVAIGGKPDFVAGSYWYVWPIVFEYRSRDDDMIAITKKATRQSDFGMLYDGSIWNGVCVGETIRCWGATINAQLNDSQLFSEIEAEVIGLLEDGTPVRLMQVSKYPIRRLER